MNFFKKSLIFAMIILLSASIYHDITSGSISANKENDKTSKSKFEADIVHIQVMPGQTVLSIVEKYNNSKSLDVNQIVIDFKMLNPHAQPYSLESYQYYYFPVYKEAQAP